MQIQFPDNFNPLDAELVAQSGFVLRTNAADDATDVLPAKAQGRRMRSR